MKNSSAVNTGANARNLKNNPTFIRVTQKPGKSKPPKKTTSRKTRNRSYITNYNPQQKTVELLDQVRAVRDEYRDYWPPDILSHGEGA